MIRTANTILLYESVVNLYVLALICSAITAEAVGTGQSNTVEKNEVRRVISGTPTGPSMYIGTFGYIHMRKCVPIFRNESHVTCSLRIQIWN